MNIKVFQYNKINKKPSEEEISRKIKIIDANDNEIKSLSPLDFKGAFQEYSYKIEEDFKGGFYTIQLTQEAN